MTDACKQIFLCLILISVLAAIAVAQPQLPAPTGLVNDFAGKLSDAKRQQLETLLENFRARSGIEVAVVTMRYDDLQGYPIEDYSLQLARKWGIGGDAQKRGLLLLVAIREPNTGATDNLYHGSTRLEVSRHLEGDLPDGLDGEIIRKMRADFQQGNFDQALTIGTQTILATLAEKLGISIEGIDASQAYHAPARRPQRSRGGGISPVMIFVIVLIFVLIVHALSRGGRGGPGGGYRRRGSGLGWLILPMIFGGRGGWGGGSWGGSSGSGWGGGDGGGDGGGFGGFGGGGDFGGGGASDNW
ncbi:MAG TPA: TPM domain-containing protein [Blastocatellia bacterium]|nr:TPM domain-containing protein [Blastocatellia bacterium]